LRTGKHVNVKPKVIQDVLVNPGIGFMTFQRFNGDPLNEGTAWTEGHPMEVFPFDGSLKTPHHPMTSIAYFRIYWKYIEPERGVRNWDLIDQALSTARSRKQTLLLRIAPHSSSVTNVDVPIWYRKLVGDQTKWAEKKWLVNPNDPNYVECFGSLIRELGKRYDNHPDLESVDMSFLGAWGEGEGSHLLSQTTREALVDAYMDTFVQTPLLMQLTDPATNGYGLSRGPVGWRVDCLGDLKPDGSHMLDCYPQQIIRCGMQDAWKKGPVSLEVCYVLQHWKNIGWDIEYNIEQSLKWHISTFNAKSSAVPPEWEPYIENWLKKMGYRFVLRKFTYPDLVKPGGLLEFTSWWENTGVAPCYKNYPIALRLQGDRCTEQFITSVDIREWLPGDQLLDTSVLLPPDLPLGHYALDLAILDPFTLQPTIQLGIEGRRKDGWYRLGAVEVETTFDPPPSLHKGVLVSPW